MKKYRSIIEVKISNAKSNYKEVSNIGKWNDIHSEHFVAKLIIKKTTNPFLTVEKKSDTYPSLFSNLDWNFNLCSLV